MENNLALTLIILGVFIIVIGGIAIFEIFESDYDKCLDQCNMHPHDTTNNEIRKECNLSCNAVSKCNLNENGRTNNN